ncbi:hypothetical protein AKJ65_05125 [candidate division MSBL1 archaeon SCGC-AAA259E19]|uniref:Uncharacterized protein n=1 Tax=candidate division MSBL1 archaeon SCGC-AAA259E19 TaxID=1698264 RepID=A0A133UIY9_9EURY|nr:hypothetical protein AKJ65_05125 [candidate division MSBL1 archaeon SCGC-AAA259E19]
MEIRLTEGERVAGCFFTPGLFLVTLGFSLWMESIPLVTFSLLGSIVWFMVTFTKYSSYRAVKKETGEDFPESSKDIIREETEEIEELKGEVPSLKSDFEKLRATLAEKGIPTRGDKKHKTRNRFPLILILNSNYKKLTSPENRKKEHQPIFVSNHLGCRGHFFFFRLSEFCLSFLWIQAF